MAGVGKVTNKKNSPPSTAGFPKGVTAKKTNNKAAVPSTMKNGGPMKGKKGC